MKEYFKYKEIKSEIEKIKNLKIKNKTDLKALRYLYLSQKILKKTFILKLKNNKYNYPKQIFTIYDIRNQNEKLCNQIFFYQNLIDNNITNIIRNLLILLYSYRMKKANKKIKKQIIINISSFNVFIDNSYKFYEHYNYEHNNMDYRPNRLKLDKNNVLLKYQKKYIKNYIKDIFYKTNKENKIYTNNKEIYLIKKVLIYIFYKLTKNNILTNEILFKFLLEKFCEYINYLLNKEKNLYLIFTELIQFYGILYLLNNEIEIKKEKKFFKKYYKIKKVCFIIEINFYKKLDKDFINVINNFIEFVIFRF